MTPRNIASLILCILGLTAGTAALIMTLLDILPFIATILIFVGCLLIAGALVWASGKR